jgi:hypothetical protein
MFLTGGNCSDIVWTDELADHPNKKIIVHRLPARLQGRNRLLPEKHICRTSLTVAIPNTILNFKQSYRFSKLFEI